MTKVFKRGDIGTDVTDLQRRLAAAGYKVSVDGWFGKETEAAVLDYQRDHLITMTGTAGPRTQASLAGNAIGNQLTIAHLRAAAKDLDVPLATLCAFADVESAGEGFDELQRPRVLFERHVFYRQLASQQKAESYAARFPMICNQARGGYAGGPAEWNRLQMAISLNRAAAIESASWGMFQIMGYHWPALGYASAEQWMSEMMRSEQCHLAALTKFIHKDDKLLAAIQAENWKEVARRYNGPAYAENQYDKKLADAAKRYQGIYEK